MKIEDTSDKELLQQADRLLYQVLWEPFGLPGDTRSKFKKVGFTDVSGWLDHDFFVNHGIRFKRMMRDV